MRVRSKLIKTINKIFQDESYLAEIDELNFDQVSKVLSDSIHIGNVGIVGNKLESMLDKNVSIQNLTSAVRLLDSLMASDTGIE